MFPVPFVREHIRLHSSPHDLVLDPFSGRGTVLLEALQLRRAALAVDINPVAVCLSRAKAETPSLAVALDRIRSLEEEYQQTEVSSLEEERQALPKFFRRAFYHTTLRQILFLRRALQASSDATDNFVAALVLGSLHGEMDRSPSYFSNQMPRTISTKPDYSVRYWKTHRLYPKKKNVFEILSQRARLRLEVGFSHPQGVAVRSDARVAGYVLGSFESSVDLVITSPPYLNVTSYEEDQWLRLWFLGGAPCPTYGTVSRDDRHSSQEKYWQFLAAAWKGIAPLMRDRATMICRIGGKRLDVDTLGSNLMATIRSGMPSMVLAQTPRVSTAKINQSSNWMPYTKPKTIEADFVFTSV